MLAIGLTPPNVATLIRVGNGNLNVKKGQLRNYARGQVSEQLREAGVSHGFIAITRGNQVIFSRSIPDNIRQRLRNVLLNQFS